MSLVQIGVRWVHLSASILLVALFLFELVVLAPFARKPPETIQSLFLSRQIRDLGLAAVVVRRFSASSLIAVAAMALTGLSNSVFMVGSVQSLLTTDYGHLLISKLILFHLMVGFGAWNLLLLKPRLAVDSSYERCRSGENTPIAISECPLGDRIRLRRDPDHCSAWNYLASDALMFLFPGFDRDLEGARSLGAAEPDGGNIVLHLSEYGILMFATNCERPFPYDFWQKAGRTKPFPNYDIYEVSKTNVTINPGCKFAYSRKIIAPVI